MNKLFLCYAWRKRTGRREVIEEDVHAVLLGPINNLYDCFYWDTTELGHDFWKDQWEEGKLSEEGIKWLNDYLNYYYPVTKRRS